MWYIGRKCMNMSFLGIKKQQKQHFMTQKTCHEMLFLLLCVMFAAVCCQQLLYSLFGHHLSCGEHLAF